MMTNIELDFYQSAIKYFRCHNNRNSDLADKRFLASAIILSGMVSNYANPVPSGFTCETAVKLADNLLKILSETSYTIQR